jgi:hypothetical protein
MTAGPSFLHFSRAPSLLLFLSLAANCFALQPPSARLLFAAGLPTDISDVFQASCVLISELFADYRQLAG